MPWTGERSWLKRLLNPSPTFQSNSQISKVLSLVPGKAIRLDLGAGGRKITPDIVAVDFVKIGGTDVIADIQEIPFRDEAVDCVFCTGTLEHVQFPESVIREIRRILKPGALAYIDVPFIQCYHPDPVDYWRFTIKGLEIMCMRNGLEKMESGVNIGTASAATWVLMEFFRSFFSSKWDSRIIGSLLAAAVSPLKYLDPFTIKSERSIFSPSAVFFIGTRSRT